MNITSSNISFTSTNREIIKNSQKVLHIISSEFPAISGTKISEFNCAQGNQQFQDFARIINNRIRNFIRNPVWKEHNKGSEATYLTLINGIKKHRVANCADFSKIWNLLAKLNGIQSIPAEIHLVSPENNLAGRIDHAIHIINLGKDDFIKLEKLTKLKNILIVDPWLGFVDYAPNAELKFKYDFAKFFKIPEDFSLMLNSYTHSEPEVSENAINFFKKNFPQFIINKK